MSLGREEEVHSNTFPFPTYCQSHHICRESWTHMVTFRFQSTAQQIFFPLGKPGRNKDESILDGVRFVPLFAHRCQCRIVLPGLNFVSNRWGGWLESCETAFYMFVIRYPPLTLHRKSDFVFFKIPTTFSFYTSLSV